MAMAPSKENIASSAMLAVAAAAASSVVTYAATKHRIKKKEQKERDEEYQERKVARELAEAEQQQRGEPSGLLVKDISIPKVYLWEVERLGNRFEAQGPEENKMSNSDAAVNRLSSLEQTFFVSPGSAVNMEKEEQQVAETHYNKLIGLHECVLSNLVRKPEDPFDSTIAYVRAGPRKKLHFDPKKVNAAIVTCGGLCPGLNNVVREITNTLVQLYGTEGTVWGIRGGYKGFYLPLLKPIRLTPEMVANIHHEGGTVLCSSRGGFDLDKIIDFLKSKNISQVYVIGGDGTHRGAFKIHDGCMKRGLNVSVAGIPKTIDNDVDYIDRSFGFSTSVEGAQAAIRSAKTEASCNLPNGIGIVKLMGRSAGFIAAHATMASGDVDLCLVPEIPIVLEGEKGCLPHLRRRVKQQGYAVVVVAEGAGEELLGTSAETDASGNKVLPKIGEFLKSKITEYFDRHGEKSTVKYIDPSYMIRSIPANASDSLYCMQLAQNAVHGAMAGFTGFSVGLCNNRMVFLPIPQLVATSPRLMDPHGRTWERILALTRQPNTAPPKKKGEKPYSAHEPTLR